MISEKTIKSVIRKILVEQASPPGDEWSRIATSQKTKFENDGCTVMQDSDSKWYYKTSSCTPTPTIPTIPTIPEVGDGVAVTAAVFA